jgi:hypothetical protein
VTTGGETGTRGLRVLRSPLTRAEVPCISKRSSSSARSSCSDGAGLGGIEFGEIDYGDCKIAGLGPTGAVEFGELVRISDGSVIGRLSCIASFPRWHVR